MKCRDDGETLDSRDHLSNGSQPLVGNDEVHEPLIWSWRSCHGFT